MSIAKETLFNKRSPRKSKKPAKQMPDITFHNIRLTKDDKPKLAEFDSMCSEMELNPIEMLSVVGGYKVSIRFDVDTDSVMVSLTGSEDSANPNVCVTTYAENVTECLIMAFYKSYNIRKAEWLVWELDEKIGNQRWG
jgi:hypothetical protein